MKAEDKPKARRTALEAKILDEVDYLIRKPMARELLGGLSEAHFDELIRQGALPRPVAIVPGGRAVGFFVSEIRNYLEKRKQEACR